MGCSCKLFPDISASQGRPGTEKGGDPRKLSVSLCGVERQSVIAASGTFGYGYEFAEFYDINSTLDIFIQGYDAGGEVREPYAACCGMRRGMLNAIGPQIGCGKGRRRKSCPGSKGVFISL